MGMKANSKHFKGTKGEKLYNIQTKIIKAKKPKRIPIEKKFKNINEYVRHPENLGKYKPKTVYNWLSRTYKVEPLSRGSLKDKSFYKGGGFKVVYEGDKLFQFHPKGSHHKGAYYKISSGEHGTHRYNLKGKEIK